MHAILHPQSLNHSSVASNNTCVCACKNNQYFYYAHAVNNCEQRSIVIASVTCLLVSHSHI